jgi:predicted DNA-binding protein
MKGARQMKATAVRLPDELMNWLREQAAENKRSLSGEVHHRIERTRQQDLALHSTTDELRP